MAWFRLRGRQSYGELEVLEYPTDARRVDALGREAPEDPNVARRIRIRRRVLGSLFLAVFVAGLVAAVFGERGLIDVVELRRELARAQGELDVQRVKVGLLGDALERIETNPMARERIAREQLGLVRRGEVDVLLPREAVEESSDAGSP